MVKKSILLSLLILLFAIAQFGCRNPNFIYEHGKPLLNGKGQPAVFLDNENAVNPTFQQLIEFLTQDETDLKGYTEPSKLFGFVCIDYAMLVHNNAEADGIRAAVVTIEFKDQKTGHALNAFNTTDKGLIYVDCTGEDWAICLVRSINGNDENDYSLTNSNKPECDSIAYIRIGKDYGRIPLSFAKETDYGFYESYTDNWQECNTLIKEVNKYYFDLLTSLYTPAFGELQKQKAAIEKKEVQISNLKSELSEYNFQPMGIVTKVNINWGSSK